MRTNNDAEGLHNAWNSQAGSNVRSYKLVLFFFKTAIKVPLNAKLFAQNKITDDTTIAVKSVNVGYKKTGRFSLLHKIKTPNIYFGLNVKEVRSLTYKLAGQLQLETPNNWKTMKTADNDWMQGFLKRNNALPSKNLAEVNRQKQTVNTEVNH